MHYKNDDVLFPTLSLLSFLTSLLFYRKIKIHPHYYHFIIYIYIYMNSLSLLLNETQQLNKPTTFCSSGLLSLLLLLCFWSVFLGGSDKLSIQNLCFCFKLKSVGEMYADTGILCPYFQNFYQEVHQLEEYCKTQKSNASMVLPLSPSLALFHFSLI